MNFLRPLLSALLLVHSFGGTSWAATVSAVRVAGAGSVVRGVPNLASPATRLGLPNTTLSAPTLTPSLALTPALSVTSGLKASAAVPAAEGLRPEAANLQSVGAFARPTTIPSAAALPAAQAPLATPASPLSQVQQTAQSLGASAAPEAARPTLDGLFDASRAPAAADLSVAGREGKTAAPLARTQVQPTRRSFWGPSRPQQDKPRSEFSRSLKVGFIGAVLPLIVTFVSITVAQLLGYELHPNYGNPSEGVVTIVQAGLFAVMAAFAAPISEEVVFRAGVMKALRGAFGWVPKLGAYVIPAVLSSALFVVIHETADPLLMATRFVHALVLAHIYHKEGLPASMAAHGFFNGLLTMPLLLTAILGPAIGGIASLALTPLSLYLAYRFWKQVKGQKADKDAGTLVPFRFSKAQATWLAIALFAAFVLLQANPIWLAGGVGLLIYRYQQKD